MVFVVILSPVPAAWLPWMEVMLTFWLAIGFPFKSVNLTVNSPGPALFIVSFAVTLFKTLRVRDLLVDL